MIMALYSNGTRFAAIITIRVTTSPNPGKTLEIGVPSAMKVEGLDVGVHDLLVEAGTSIQLLQGVEAEFLASRAAS